MKIDKEVYLRTDDLRPSEWRCELFGAGGSMVLTPMLGQEPNWFWRWTQFLIFGNRWYKVKS